ncbi:restriction endonuclease subunit S [Methanolobus zinderi]|uniref:Restriction endonuclease subunit S n=1 Tax=Methanolobus zinderi TaxID=536044 RepID=A0A7D5IP63_9EURY|nr:restriction endonuclease subunit S [Methanolobus zinderi]QLC50065.1 restriction endonuclease subunit S [Methanolobus zinderi]
MSCEWEEVRLEDITSVLGDGLHGTPKYDENGEYYFINGNNLSNGTIVINDKTKRASKEEYLKHKKNLNERTILVSINGTLGNIALYKGEKVFLGKSACYFNVIDEIDKQYIKYVLMSDYFQNYITSLATGTTIKNVSLKLMRDFTFKLPPLIIQKKISKFLEDLDDKIELNRQMNTILEQMAQAIFKHWFIDFEFPDENGQPYRSSGGEMVDSELGEIPAGWEVKILSDLCEYIMSGGTPRTKVPEYWDGDIPWLSSGETRNRFIINTEKSISKIGVENSSTRLARSGSTVIASAGQGHTRGQTSLLLLDTYVNQSVVSLAADTKLISDFYLFFNLARRYDEMRRISDSHSSRGSLTTKLLGNLKVTCPPIDLIRRFDQIAEPIVNQIHYNLEQADTLSQFRDSLLPKLMSGKIRVKQ